MTRHTGHFRIGKTFPFEATRTVDGRLDGHSFSAELVLSADRLTGPGFVADFGELRPAKGYIDANLDHRLLDEAVGPDTSCASIAEHLAAWCRQYLPPEVADRLERVEVRTGRPAPVQDSAVQFAASHRLEGLAPDHQCGRLHGHSYLVSPLPGAEPLPARVGQYARAALEGELLNEVLEFQPTSELLARHLAGVAGPGTGGLRVSETPSSWAEFRTGAR